MEVIESILGIVGAGMVAAPVNWRWSVDEIVEALSKVGPEVIVAAIDETENWELNDMEVVQGVSRQLPTVKCILVVSSRGHGREATLLEGDSNGILLDRKDVAVVEYASLCRKIKKQDDWMSLEYSKSEDDVAFLIFTSGTTSNPKGALISHRNMIFQCSAKERYCGYCASDVYLHMAPLFHVGGLCSALSMVSVGAFHVFMNGFRARRAIEIIQEHGITAFIAVPTMLIDMVHEAEGNRGSTESQLQSVVLSSVTKALVGAGGLPSNHVQKIRRLMPNATLLNAYGMTEACSSLTFSTLIVPDAKYHPTHENQSSLVYVGQTPEGIELAVLTKSEQICREGEGEIVTKGPHLFVRYWKASDNSPSNYAVDSEGRQWFRTGDLGLIQSEDVWLLGRAKDMIKTGGENVAAAEVERLLMNHPAIMEVAIVGIQDARWGEAVSAAIVLAPRCQGKMSADNKSGTDSSKRYGIADPQSAIFKSIKNFCKSNGLAGFKTPKLVCIFKSLPRNGTGKVEKAHVKQVIQSALARSRL
jgi:acyl-activating enzyme 14